MKRLVQALAIVALATLGCAGCDHSATCHDDSSPSDTMEGMSHHDMEGMDHDMAGHNMSGTGASDTHPSMPATPATPVPISEGETAWADVSADTTSPAGVAKLYLTSFALSDFVTVCEATFAPSTLTGDDPVGTCVKSQRLSAGAASPDYLTGLASSTLNVEATGDATATVRVGDQALPVVFTEGAWYIDPTTVVTAER